MLSICIVQYFIILFFYYFAQIQRALCCTQSCKSSQPPELRPSASLGTALFLEDTWTPGNTLIQAWILAGMWFCKVQAGNCLLQEQFPAGFFGDISCAYHGPIR